MANKRKAEEEDSAVSKRKAEEEGGAGSNPEPLMQLVKPRVLNQGRHLHLMPKGAAAAAWGFCEFVETAAEEQVVRFFREAIAELEQTRQIRDYHLKVKPSLRPRPGGTAGGGEGGGFLLETFYGEQRDGPEEVAPEACISCRDDAPLFPGAAGSVLAGECVLAEFGDQPYVQCSLDAKARPGFIVTPRRHVERLGELDDVELQALWSVAVRAVRSEGLTFTSMILNHGSYRNLPHLHLKIWVEDRLWRQRTAMTWSREKKELWARLERMTAALPKKRTLCPVFSKGRNCRFGGKCRFTHQRDS